MAVYQPMSKIGPPKLLPRVGDRLPRRASAYLKRHDLIGTGWRVPKCKAVTKGAQGTPVAILRAVLRRILRPLRYVDSPTSRPLLVTKEAEPSADVAGTLGTKDRIYAPPQGRPIGAPIRRHVVTKPGSIARLWVRHPTLAFTPEMLAMGHRLPLGRHVAVIAAAS